jgi:hypothetical protein
LRSGSQFCVRDVGPTMWHPPVRDAVRRSP